MENNNNNLREANVSEINSPTSWTNDKLSHNPFEAQIFASDNVANGTTKEAFDGRRIIDQKNLVEIYIGRLGIKWVSSILAFDE